MNCCHIQDCGRVPPATAAANQEPLQKGTLIGRVVSWIREERPLIQKILVTCLVTLAALALCLSVIGIPVVYLAWQENQRQANVAKEAEKEKLELEAYNKLDDIEDPDKTKEERLQEIIKGIGTEKYNSLPILDLADRKGWTDYIDFLTESDLSAPAMKGIDCFNRHFITFKVLDKDTGNRFVQTVFQRYSHRSSWAYGIHQGYFGNIFDSSVMTQKSIYRLASVLNGTNKRYVLVN